MKYFFNLKNALILSCVFLIFTILISCAQKVEESKKPATAPQQISEITDEMYKLLENAPDPLDMIALYKKFGAKYIDMIPPAKKFESVADRKKMLMRFGMLTVDIAYEKIIGGKTQIVEYEQIYQKYINELNIAPFINESFNQYINKLAVSQIDDKLFADLRVQWRQDKQKLLDKVKSVDEEFIVYFTIGFLIESTRLGVALAEKDKNLEKKFADSLSAANKVPNWQFVDKLTATQKYSDYSMKLKPVINIYFKFIESKKIEPENAASIVLKLTNDFVEDVLK